MARSISITVHPSGPSGELLTVSDAMRQVLDLVGALEGVEAGEDRKRQIEWRLVEAHTNSPPFTVTAEAFAKDPHVSVTMEVDRVFSRYNEAVNSLLAGKKPPWLEIEPSKLLKRALKRNLNGVGHTDVSIQSELAFSIIPSRAKIALAALERAEIDEAVDLSRSEYGSVEGRVIGLTKWYSFPTLIFEERLSEKRTMCVLDADLAEKIGPEHRWSEAWSGEYLRVGGELFYAADGSLKRISASSFETIEWTDIPIRQLKEIDILQGRSVQEHLDEFWGERFG